MANMRSHIQILELLVWLWDPEQVKFDLQHETLELTIEDVYYVIGLSHKGEPVNLGGTGSGGDPLSIQDYVNAYCLLGTQKSGMQIPIAKITSFPLNVLVSTIVWVVGTYALHLDTQTHMHIVVEFL